MGSPSKAKRNLEIYELRKRGITFQKIANYFGISVERVRQIYRSEKFKNEEIDKNDIVHCMELSVRTINCLRRSDIKTKDYLVELLNDKNGAGVYGIGENGILEIEKFVGFEIDSKKAKYPERIGNYVYHRNITILRKKTSKEE